MISQEMVKLGKRRSVIREAFEYAKKRSALIGEENVFDFSIGNPNVPAPESVNETIIELLKQKDPIVLHGYSSAQGDQSVRSAIAKHLNTKFTTELSPDNIYITTGAAAALSISIKAIAVPDDEFIIFAPYFPEYKIFIEGAGAKPVAVGSDNSFQVDAGKLECAITPKTKAIILNSPNNPSGVVLSKKTIKKICGVLNKKEQEYGHSIYLISDEPYREIVYDNIEVPYLTHYYNNTFVCYSYSKSLSIPGERIGYIVVSDKMHNGSDVYAAVCGAGRALGYVCAPSMFQHVIAKCIDEVADISVYEKNRDILYRHLLEYGYSCIKPDGAFYLFVKSMESDAAAFCDKAKEYELLLVPGDDFGCPGYVRIAYCVTTEQILGSLPAFEKLAKDYSRS